MEKQGAQFRSSYSYEGDALRRLDAFVPSRKITVPVKNYLKSLANLSSEQGLAGRHHKNETTFVDIPHLIGGRNVSIKYREVQIDGSRMSIPSVIEVRSGDVTKTDRISLIKSAHLLGVKSTSVEFGVPTSQRDLRFRTDPKSYRERFSKAWSSGFESDYSKALMAEIEVEMPFAASSSIHERFANLSMRINAAIQTNDADTAEKLTIAWQSELSSSPLRCLYPEMAMQLLKRVQWSASEEVFSRLRAVLVDRAPFVPGDVLLDGGLNCRFSTTMPCVLFELCCFDRTTGTLRRNNDEMRLLYLAASLVPSLQRQVSTAETKFTFAVYDTNFAKSWMSRTKIRAIAKTIRERSRLLYQEMSVRDQETWRDDVGKIVSWVRE